MTGVISDAVNCLWFINLKDLLAFVIAIRLVSDGAAATGVDTYRLYLFRLWLIGGTGTGPLLVNLTTGRPEDIGNT